jgi:hypothetical protein
MKTIRGVTTGASFPVATKPFKNERGGVNNRTTSNIKRRFKLFNVTHQPFQPPFFQAESLRSEGSQPALKFAQEIAYNPDLLSASCKKEQEQKTKNKLITRENIERYNNIVIWNLCQWFPLGHPSWKMPLVCAGKVQTRQQL